MSAKTGAAVSNAYGGAWVISCPLSKATRFPKDGFFVATHSVAARIMGLTFWTESRQSAFFAIFFRI